MVNKTDRFIFKYEYQELEKVLEKVPVICEEVSDNVLRDIITGELIYSRNYYTSEEKCMNQAFLTYNFKYELSVSELADILKTYFDGKYKNENIARYRARMEEVRKISAEKTYKIVAESKQNNKKVRESEEYVKRFMKDIR